MSKVDGCADCEKPHETCPDCKRPLANEHDEGIHNTGECGCDEARSLCWRRWAKDNVCRPRSVYDPEHE
jgi:hypothetical protein